MQLNFAPAPAHHSTPSRWPALLAGLVSGRSAKKATQPHPADYRSNGLQSHEELPMAHHGSIAPVAADTTVDATDEPQAARPPRLVPYVAFFVAVFASMAAAAAVVSNDLPVMVVGLM